MRVIAGMIIGAAILSGCSRSDPWVEGTDFPRPTVQSVPLGVTITQFETVFGPPSTQQEHLGSYDPGNFLFSGGAQYLPTVPPGTKVDDRILNYIYRINAQDGSGDKGHVFKTLYVGFRDGKLIFWDYHSNRHDASGTQFNADGVAALKEGNTTLLQAVTLLGQPSTVHSAWTVPPSARSGPPPASFYFPYTSTGLRYEMSLDEPDNKQADTMLSLLFDPSGRLKNADVKKDEHEKQAFPEPRIAPPRVIFIPTPSAHR